MIAKAKDLFCLGRPEDIFDEVDESSIINNINYLEKKLNYSERTIFYKIDINGNEVYRYCLKNSKIFITDSFTFNYTFEFLVI